MRGSPFAERFRRDADGIIPAHAGLTGIGVPVRACEGDHPRACGAHETAAVNTARAQGSSPRMRGSPGFVVVDQPADGIIPAHAGLTSLDSMACMVGWDHPRACGAHGTGIHTES